MVPTSVRLDNEAKSKITRIAKAKKVKEAVVIRWAVDNLDEDNIFLSKCPINSQIDQKKSDDPQQSNPGDLA